MGDTTTALSGKELVALHEIKRHLLECESYACAYNDTGVCCIALVKESGPNITEEDGCQDGIFDVFRS